MSQAHATTHAAHEHTKPSSHGAHHVNDAGFGHASNGKIAMWIFLVTDGLTFAGLLLGYGYLRMKNAAWPDPQHLLGIALTGFATFLLICSSLTMVLSLAAAAEKNKAGMLKWLFLTAVG